jgi:hypothetical protein
MTEMMSFAPRPSAEWSANFERIIDRAMEARQQAEPPRNYLGASRVGDDCLRKLAYEFHHTPKDEGREFTGRTLRIFERGHDGEARMAARLRLAGFTIVTEKKDGGQIGFATGWSDERQCFTFSGHLDGAITSAPYESGLVCPALWENKVLGEKSFNDLVRKGVRASKPVYFAQMQLYMSYLELADNPALFTAENGNTGEIYAERVPFDRAAAQAASDKAVKVITSREPEELPRCANAATDFRCKWCDYQDRCWSQVAANAPDAAKWQFGQ